MDGLGTYLARLRLALATDPLRLDEVNRVFPRQRDPGGGLPVRELFLMFPHVLPFADSVRLQEGERNDSLYRTPAYLLRTQGPVPRFTLDVRYEATGAGDRSNLSLGTIQVRAGSERLYVGDRLLVDIAHAFDVQERGIGVAAEFVTQLRRTWFDTPCGGLFVQSGRLALGITVGREAEQAVVEIDVRDVGALALVAIQALLPDQVVDRLFGGPLTHVQLPGKLWFGRDQVPRNEFAGIDQLPDMVLYHLVEGLVATARWYSPVHRLYFPLCTKTAVRQLPR